MKDEILQTSLNQFLKYGIREMSIKKLVAPMGISTKTVYKYFKNKEELLEQALHFFYAQQYQELEKLSSDQSAVSLLLDVWYMAAEREYKVTNVFFHDLHYYYPDLENKIEAAISKKFHKKFIQIIQQGITDGVFRSEINPEVVMEGIYILYSVTVRSEKMKRFRADPLNILLNTIVIYIRGFCTQAGIKELDKHIKTFVSFGKAKKVKQKMTNKV
ncbi:MAG: TetR/AcrR family transcriptional regulator [Parafilimonas sp.]